MAEQKLLLLPVERRVICPHGRGQQALRACWFDSATHYHPCSLVDGGRCTFAVEWGKRHGWRSWALRPLAGPLPKVTLVFAPLDTEGLSWLACDVLTGRRKEVVLDVRGHACDDGSLLTPPFTGWVTTMKTGFHTGCPTCHRYRNLGGCSWHRRGSPYPAPELVQPGEIIDTGIKDIPLPPPSPVSDRRAKSRAMAGDDEGEVSVIDGSKVISDEFNALSGRRKP